jgi:chromosome segregation ATPase
MVRQAKAAGSQEIANRLQHLRRPTRSAWLVNLLASDPTAMQRLSTLGRELRDAQTELAHAELRRLAEQRRQLIADLRDRAQAHADEAGLRLTPTVLSEVEATLQAALVDLAGALTIRNGRLVRPLSHSGFGPRPRQVSLAQLGSAAQLRPVEVSAGPTADLERPLVEDELAARRGAMGRLRVVELVDVTDQSSVAGDDDSAPASAEEKEARRTLRQAEEELAAAEASHWQAEFELADAEGAVEAAVDRLSSLDTQRIEARRDRVTAQRYLAEARSQQRNAVNALAEARRRLDAARQLAQPDE